MQHVEQGVYRSESAIRARAKRFVLSLHASNGPRHRTSNMPSPIIIGDGARVGTLDTFDSSAKARSAPSARDAMTVTTDTLISTSNRHRENGQ